MFLHRKETERLSNPWWWRPMQACILLFLLPVALIVQFPLYVFGVSYEVSCYLRDWNRCEITARPRPWWKKLFEPRKGS